MLAQVIGQRALVVRLGEVGAHLDGAGKMLDRVVEGAAFDRLRAARQLVVGLRRPAAEPHRPQRVLGELIDNRIAIAQLLRDLGDAATLANQGQREQCNFLRIGVTRGEKILELLFVPAGF